MIYLLDSNACIQLLNDKHPGIVRHLRQHPPVEIALCSVVKAELLFGAYRSGRVEANLQRLKIFFESLKACLLMMTVPIITHVFELIYTRKVS
jgi:tRNA(fMet)-specific endonuclease VapC